MTKRDTARDTVRDTAQNPGRLYPGRRGMRPARAWARRSRAPV